MNRSRTCCFPTLRTSPARRRSKRCSTSTSSGRKRRRSPCLWRFTTITSASCTGRGTMWSFRSPTSCSSGPREAAKRSSPRRWPGSWTSPSPSPTPPRSPKRAMWARTWRTSSPVCCRRRISTWSAPSGASSTSTRSTRSPARARTCPLPGTFPARACSRRC